MSQAAYDYDNSSSKRLLPKDPLGQHFVKYFQHAWKFIQAPVPKYGEKPSWRTETRYPLEPRSLWSKFQNPDLLLGLRLGTFTNYCVLDIDKGSKNHPDNSKEKFNQILVTLSRIGLNLEITIRSSESGGLHIYFFLPECVHSLSLALALKHALISDGFQLIKGELEVFPNPKPYNEFQPTSFNAHRLPLQANSFILDWDLQPTSEDIKVFLDCADLTAQSQDMEILKEAMKAAEKWRKSQYRVLKSGKKSAAEFCADLEEQIEPGWTGFHQTNALLLKIAKYGIIFLHHLGQNLIDYMQETVPSLPGYKEYCRHQHEIGRRIRDIAASAERYPYVPCPNSPLRQNTYKNHFFGAKEEENKVVRLHPSKKRQAKKIEEVKAVITALKNQGIYPETAQKRSEAIIRTSKEMFGRGGSQTTLHKPEYLPLWHPDYDNTPTQEQAEERVNADSTEEKPPVSPPAPDTVSEELKALQEQDSSHLHFESLYEGCVPPAAQAQGEVGGSVASDDPQPCEDKLTSPADILEDEITGFYDGQQPQAASPSEASLAIFLYLAIFQIFANLENQRAIIIFLYLAIWEIFLTRETINSEFLNFLIDKIHSFYDFHQFNDNQNLSTVWGGARKNSHKPNLSFAETVSPPNAEAASNPSPPSEPTSKASTGDENRLQVANHPDDSSTPSSPSQTPQSESSNSPPPENVPQPSTTAEHFSRNDFTPLEYLTAIRFELEAQKKAREYRQEFCSFYPKQPLMPQQRQDYDKLIKYYLMLKSSHASAKKRSEEWFAAHQELVTNARELGLWDYLEQLPPPDF